MLCSPAHFSPVTFLEAVTAGEGNVDTLEAQLYSVLHKTQGIGHPSVNLETRIPHLPAVSDDVSFIYTLRERVVGWLEYILNTNGVKLENVPTSVDVRNDEELISFFAVLHRKINDRFNAHVGVWQKLAKTAERVSGELQVARLAANVTGERVQKAATQLHRYETAEFPDSHRIVKAQEQVAKAEKAHQVNVTKLNTVQANLDVVNAEFAEVRSQMIPLRKMESVSRYLNVQGNTISDAHVLATIQEIITSFPEWWLGVLNIVDVRVCFQSH